MKTIPLLATAILCAGAMACASTAPPELQSARTAYQSASHGPAPRVAPADFHAARETLNVAEVSYDMNGDNDETKDIAYAARRRAEFADVRARTMLNSQKLQASQVEEQSLKDQQAKIAAAELANTQARLDAERKQREEAERALAMKADARGKVIALSGSVLFASGKSQLLPTAERRLKQVADVLALQDKDAKIRIEGFTDSTGSASTNETLSQARAESVRNYLSQHGIQSDRITTVGMGPANPVADNKSAEGRANNRRVEIIVQDRQTTPPLR